MKQNNFFIDNQLIKLEKQIGKGGEGEVYLIEGNQKIAVKILTGKYDQLKVEKIKAITSLELSKNSPLVAYPNKLVTSKEGKVLGFSMMYVEGHKAIHELYGVKSRKTNFPKSDFKFLIRVATNTARAIAQVHSSNCIIGDINHSGILVSNNATVVLIDADSFQINFQNKIYPCVVGVPDFTPPELHGSSLRDITRTSEHDNFGLAVLMFQLLFMGKHPFSGKYSKKDLTLSEMIAQDLFVYSRRSIGNSSPPPGAPTLEILPVEMQEAFERSFSKNHTNRTTAQEWIKLLVDLESKLKTCSRSSMHIHPSHSIECPWCKMETSAGILLFIENFSEILNSNIQALILDVDKILSKLNQLNISQLNFYLPKLNLKIPLVSAIAAKEKRRIKFSTLGSRSLYLILFIIFLNFPSFLIPILIGCCLVYWSRKRFLLSDEKWQNQYEIIMQQHDSYVRNWKNRINPNELQNLETSVRRMIGDYKELKPLKESKLNNLKNNHREKQLEIFLDKFLIKNASITKIGPSRKVTLASYGVETAADISYGKITSIPGFGDAMASELVNWRSSMARKFNYNPSLTQEDKDDQKKIEMEFLTKNNLLQKQILENSHKIDQLFERVKLLQQNVDPAFQSIVDQKMQFETDMKFLEIQIPIRNQSFQNVIAGSTYSTGYKTNQNTGYQGTSSATPTCPRCGSVMVSRIAKRGLRRGNSFWGCSRFPICRGTR